MYSIIGLSVQQPLIILILFDLNRSIFDEAMREKTIFAFWFPLPSDLDL